MGVNLGYAAGAYRCDSLADVGRNRPLSLSNRDVAMPDNAYFGGNYHDPLVTSSAATQGLAAE